MGDGDDSAILEDAAAQGLLKQGIGFNIYRGLWFLRQRWAILVSHNRKLTVASSRTRMLLGVSNARANETSCRCPWLRFDPTITDD